MRETLFYLFGLSLTAFALIVSFVGLRSRNFPSKGLGRLTTLVFAALIIGTASFAVLLSREEAEHRESELAAEQLEEAEAGEESEAPGEPAAGAPAPEGSEAPPEGGAAPAPGPVALAADPEQLAYDTDQLTAAAGQVTIAFDNPSQIPHNVVVEDDGGVIGGTPQISAQAADLELDLEAGEYTFFCSVLGHREAGMEGSLTVE